MMEGIQYELDILEAQKLYTGFRDQMDFYIKMTFEVPFCHSILLLQEMKSVKLMTLK